MKGELYYVQHPYRSRIAWIIFYAFLFIALLFGIYKLADTVRTRSLPTGDIRLKVPYSKYLVGEAVSFSITNNYNSPVYITNNCPSEPLAVYKRENNSWIRLHDTASISACADEQRQVEVPAKGVVNGSFAPWKHLFNTPGKYMIVAYVEYYNALPYQEFEVINPPSTSPQNKNTPPTNNDNNEEESAAPLINYTQKKPATITTSNGSSISVQYDSTTIYVTSVAPAAGCTYEGGQSGAQVEVTFICGSQQTQVQLALVNGQLVQQIETGN